MRDLDSMRALLWLTWVALRYAMVVRAPHVLYPFVRTALRLKHGKRVRATPTPELAGAPDALSSIDRWGAPDWDADAEVRLAVKRNARRHRALLRIARRITPPANPLLQDPRVRSLQRAIIVRVFQRELSVAVEPMHLEVLSNFASVAWIVSSLLTAAGMVPARCTPFFTWQGPPVRELPQRCTLVLPALTASLSVYLTYQRQADASGIRRPPVPPTVWGTLYPHALACAARQANRLSTATQHTLRRQLSLMRARHLCIAWYLHTLALLRRAARAGHVRALNHLERIALTTHPYESMVMRRTRQ